MKKTVLIIEDHKAVQFSIFCLLETDFEVVLASNGEEGIKAIRNNPKINLIITDYNMPVLNGFEVLKWVKKNYPNIPVIIWSGEDIELEARQLGAAAVLEKPADLDLIGLIKQILGED